jgi:hypothetical protein
MFPVCHRVLNEFLVTIPRSAILEIQVPDTSRQHALSTLAGLKRFAILSDTNSQRSKQISYYRKQVYLSPDWRQYPSCSQIRPSWSCSIEKQTLHVFHNHLGGPFAGYGCHRSTQSFCPEFASSAPVGSWRHIIVFDSRHFGFDRVYVCQPRASYG